MSVLRFICKRLLTLIPVLLGITILAFILGTSAPGDPVDSILNPDGDQRYTQEQYETVRRRLGLDDPKPVQYIKWLKNAVTGELGQSFFSNKSIQDQLAMRVPITLRLAALSMAFTVFFGIGLGVLMAMYKDSWLDHVISVSSTVFLSIPGFWLAIILILVFAEKWKILPTSGIESFRSYILPAVTVSLGTIGTCSRLTRTSLLDELGKQYMTVANAKGLARKAAALKHAFVNALVPITTYLGTYFAGIIGGSSIAEVIFSIPGLGSYAISAVQSRDYLVVQAYVLFTGLVYVVMNLVIDLVYVVINPKIRVGEKVG